MAHDSFDKPQYDVTNFYWPKEKSPLVVGLCTEVQITDEVPANDSTTRKVLYGIRNDDRMASLKMCDECHPTHDSVEGRGRRDQTLNPKPYSTP